MARWSFCWFFFIVEVQDSLLYRQPEMMPSFWRHLWHGDIATILKTDDVVCTKNLERARKKWGPLQIVTHPQKSVQLSSVLNLFACQVAEADLIKSCLWHERVKMNASHDKFMERKKPNSFFFALKSSCWIIGLLTNGIACASMIFFRESDTFQAYQGDIEVVLKSEKEHSQMQLTVWCSSYIRKNRFLTSSITLVWRWAINDHKSRLIFKHTRFRDRVCGCLLLCHVIWFRILCLGWGGAFWNELHQVAGVQECPETQTRPALQPGGPSTQTLVKNSAIAAVWEKPISDTGESCKEICHFSFRIWSDAVELKAKINSNIFHECLIDRTNSLLSETTIASFFSPFGQTCSYERGRENVVVSASVQSETGSG